MPRSAWPLNATGGLVTQDGSSHVVRHMASEGLVTYSSPSCPLLAAFKHSPVRVGGPHLTPTRYLRLRLVRLVCPAASILYRYPIPGRRLRPRQGTPVGAPGDSGGLRAQRNSVSSPRPSTPTADRTPGRRPPRLVARSGVACRVWNAPCGASASVRRAVGTYGAFRLSTFARRPPRSPRHPAAESAS